MANHLKIGVIVQVEDSARPRHERLRYRIKMVAGVGHVFDAGNPRLGFFAVVHALVEHAENVMT